MGTGDVAAPELGGVAAGQTALHVSSGAADGTTCRRLAQTEGDRADQMCIAFDRPVRAPPVTADRVNRVRAIVVGTDPGDCDRLPADRIRTVQSTDDLAGVGIRVGETLDELGTADRPLVACCDGVEAVVEAVSFQTAFEFVHLLAKQLASAGARTHFHFDPTGQEEAVVSRLSALFDVVVREDPDGSLAVRSQ